MLPRPSYLLVLNDQTGSDDDLATTVGTCMGLSRKVFAAEMKGKPAL